MIGWWEYSPIEFENTPKSEWAVVLTGVANNRLEPTDRVYFNKGADRVFHTYQLYKMGKVEKILISGGHGGFTEADYSEAATLKRAFLTLGVPENNIHLEENSKNTHQSAQNSKSILNERGVEKILLITSSFHMKRARACFEKEGLSVNIFPTDFYQSPRRFTPDAWIPNPRAMIKFSIIFREIAGIFVYMVVGYV